jgi:c-di-GMP-binding flagellar brake protein YcgR
MLKTSYSDPPAHLQRRRYHRYTVQCPVAVACSVGNSVSRLHAISKNVSIGGLLLEAPSAIPQNCPVEFAMIIEGSHIIRPIQLVGEGKVVRIESSPTTGFDIAVECSRPITEIEKYFVGSAD